MTRLLPEIVSSFYDASTAGGLWSECLEGLCGAFGADVCGLGWHDYGLGLGGFEHSVNIGAEYVASYEQRFSGEDVWLRREDVFRGGDEVICGDEIVSEEEVLGSSSYQEWYRPQDLFYPLYGILDRRGGRVLYLMFGRARHRGRFGEDEVGVLRRLLPKLQRGYRAGERYRRIEGLRRAASDVLDAFPMGVVFLGAGGDVVAANRQARETIDGGEGLVVGDGILWVDWGWRRVRVRDLVLRVMGRGGRVNGLGSEGPAFTVPRSSGKRPLSVLIAPLAGATAGAGAAAATGADQAVAVLYIGDPERAPEIDRERLSQLYGLSRAEARVVALLAQGHRLDEVAEKLGIAYETVRKHLKQSFGKTGADRQAELMRLLTTGPAVLRQE